MDQELIAYLDKRFGEVNEEMAALKKAVRGNGVEIEGLRAHVESLTCELDAATAQLEFRQTDIARLESDRCELESTISWRIRARLIPFVRPIVGRLRRAG